MSEEPQLGSRRHPVYVAACKVAALWSERHPAGHRDDDLDDAIRELAQTVAVCERLEAS